MKMTITVLTLFYKYNTNFVFGTSTGL